MEKNSTKIIFRHFQALRFKVGGAKHNFFRSTLLNER